MTAYVIPFLYGFISLVSMVWGWNETFRRKNVYAQKQFFYLLGIFVAGDAIIFGLFGLVGSVIVLVSHNTWFGLSLWAYFWVVRSLGETHYWLNQQFSTIERNPPHTLFGSQWIGNDSLWFVYQIMWQCLTVIFVTLAVFTTSRWLGH